MINAYLLTDKPDTQKIVPFKNEHHSQTAYLEQKSLISVKNNTITNTVLLVRANYNMLSSYSSHT